jgi:hypothetical protein
MAQNRNIKLARASVMLGQIDYIRLTKRVAELQTTTSLFCEEAALLAIRKANAVDVKRVQQGSIRVTPTMPTDRYASLSVKAKQLGCSIERTLICGIRLAFAADLSRLKGQRRRAA